MAEQEYPEKLRKFDPNYPKALYKSAERGEEVSPAYERIIVSEQGQAQRVKDRYSYVTELAYDIKEEKELLKEGWVETPAKLQHS